MSTPREVESAGRWSGRPLAESRWAQELARLSVDPVPLGRGVAHGDGRPVVLMPGFLAGDPTLLGLIVNRKAYRAIADALALPEIP